MPERGLKVVRKRLRVAKKIFGAFVLLGLVLGCSVPLATGQQERFGIRGILGTKDTAEAVKAARRCGASWARIVVFWDKVEPAKGRFTWHETDAIIGDLLGNGMRVLVTIRSYSRWASPKSKVITGKRKKWRKYKVSGMPADKNILSYRTFVQRLVERYDGDDDFGDLPPLAEMKKSIRRNPIKYWQIENEPGGPDVNEGSNFWNGTAEELARLTMLASDAMKKADPDAKIVLSGFGYNAMKKCRDGGYPGRMLQIFKNKNYDFDVFDIHNYQDVMTIFEQVADVRRLLEGHGFPRTRIWMTETDFNWRKLKLGISHKSYSERRAISMVKRHVVAFGLGVEKVFQWTLSDFKGASWPPKKRAEFTTFRGILDENLKPKPISVTYQLMISKLDGFTSAEEISKGSSNRVFRFLIGRKPIFVAWTNRAPSSLSLDMDKVRVTDVFGKETVGSGRSIGLSTIPVFVEGLSEKK